MDLSEGAYEERLKNGELLLFSRNRIFYARIYKGEGTRRYLFRSLKTKDLHQAREKADEFFHEIRLRKRDNLPLDTKRFKDVMAEYLKLRKSQFERGTYKQANKVNQQQTGEQNLRQMVRVSKFLVAYCGNMAIEKVDNAVLADYVPWRRDFYRRMPEHQRPRNYRLDPADKTLEWETTFALTVIKWAHERGYRGQKPLPKFRAQPVQRQGVSKPRRRRTRRRQIPTVARVPRLDGGRVAVIARGHTQHAVGLISNSHDLVVLKKHAGACCVCEMPGRLLRHAQPWGLSSTAIIGGIGRHPMKAISELSPEQMRC
jgi:hypothetical protein